MGIIDAFQKVTFNIDALCMGALILPIGLSIFLYVLSDIEFIYAQAPFNMKGLMLGIACALATINFGLGSEAFINSVEECSTDELNPMILNNGRSHCMNQLARR